MNWISVKDRLPEYKAQACGVEFVYVLAYGKNIAPTICEFSGGRFKAWWADEPIDITHWMPIPKKAGEK